MHAARFADLFLELFVPADFQPRAALGFFAGHAGFKILLNLLIEVESQLGVRFRFDDFAPQKRT